ncbi:hypothetical protein [Chitinophaga sancti]|uniref:DUF4783 domain-containing protein n=1 Tax=Chitinophaga sancti TaxID=1004 RepID=A0A1K1SSU7_9BACT|nr:hypothetical protein [Chitinophaga sancti]WQD65427.1 hypothetical protein U0033_13585 [Chitinophaga sancti]WQG88950.1 hypothetical protein SR876_28885 [Chitinophaga sancti]SFW87300.1 hypothetical protein SAMN05661012_06043 [Chitinophaga sancti]
MKLLTSFVLILFITVSVRSQDQKTLILNQLKEKKIDSVLLNCDLPFTFSGLSVKGEEVIKDRNLLANRIKDLVKRKYFDQYFASSDVERHRDEVFFTKRSFDSDGELESEYGLIFAFRKGKDGKLKLWRIRMAG